MNCLDRATRWAAAREMGELLKRLNLSDKAAQSIRRELGTDEQIEFDKGRK